MTVATRKQREKEEMRQLILDAARKLFLEKGFEQASIRAIAERTVPQSLATIDSRGPVRGTLELAAGTAERLDIRVGDRVLQRIFGNAP